MGDDTNMPMRERGHTEQDTHTSINTRTRTYTDATQSTGHVHTLHSTIRVRRVPPGACA